jgi:hypothetical protein
MMLMMIMITIVMIISKIVDNLNLIHLSLIYVTVYSCMLSCQKNFFYNHTVIESQFIFIPNTFSQVTKGWWYLAGFKSIYPQITVGFENFIIERTKLAVVFFICYISINFVFQESYEDDAYLYKTIMFHIN